MYNLHLLLLGLAILSNTILIYVLYRYSQKELTVIISFIVLLISINTWAFPKFVTNAFLVKDLVFETLSRISAIGYISVPVAFLIFSLSYGMKTEILKKFKFWFFLLVPALIFLYLSWSSNLISVHDFQSANLYSWGYETPAGELYYLFIIWFVGISFLAYFILIRHYFSVNDPIKKKQASFVLLSVILPLAIGTITNGVLPALNIFIIPTGLALSLTSVMSAVIVYAIFKYGLFMISPLAVLSSIDHSIITIDLKGNIMQMNEHAERSLKIEETKAAGRGLGKYLHVQHQKQYQKNKFTEILNSVIKSGRSMTFNTYSKSTSAKNLSPYTISITPIYSSTTLIGANVFLLDESDTKNREKQQESYLAMLSHELKTPITTIKMYNQHLVKNISKKDKENVQVIDKMAQQISRIDKLIKDFYELSLLHTEEPRIEKEYFGVDDFINAVVEDMQMTYKDCDIVVRGRTNCVVFADKNKIEQVLINFINNAIKYSPKRSRIKILLNAKENRVIIGVKDRGVGIKPEHQNKIFERFYKIKDNSKEKSGLGVGLFIASTIVKIHNGKIWVRSTKGEGSIFYFSLPVSNIGGSEIVNASKNYDLSYH